MLDAQSTRTSPQGGEKGYDAGKKVKGRKRNLIVDTLGFVLAVTVTTAGLQDREAAYGVLDLALSKNPKIERLYVDGGYAGKWAQWVEREKGIVVEVKRSKANRVVGKWQQVELPIFEVETRSDGFIPIAKRWVVERTHAWNEKARRLLMHHDRLSAVSEKWVWLAEAKILMRRFTNIFC